MKKMVIKVSRAKIRKPVPQKCNGIIKSNKDKTKMRQNNKKIIERELEDCNCKPTYDVIESECDTGTICTCKPTCSVGCKGECGCVACHDAYADFLSVDYE